MDGFRIEQDFLLSSTFQGKVDGLRNGDLLAGVVADSSFAGERG